MNDAISSYKGLFLKNIDIQKRDGKYLETGEIFLNGKRVGRFDDNLGNDSIFIKSDNAKKEILDIATVFYKNKPKNHPYYNAFHNFYSLINIENFIKDFAWHSQLFILFDHKRKANPNIDKIATIWNGSPEPEIKSIPETKSKDSALKEITDMKDKFGNKIDEKNIIIYDLNDFLID